MGAREWGYLPPGMGAREWGYLPLGRGAWELEQLPSVCNQERIRTGDLSKRMQLQ